MTLLALTELARTLIRGGRVVSLPLEVKVAMSAPVSAFTTVKLCTTNGAGASAASAMPDDRSPQARLVHFS